MTWRGWMSKRKGKAKIHLVDDMEMEGNTKK